MKGSESMTKRSKRPKRSKGTRSLFPKPCSAVGCSKLTYDRFCNDHKDRVDMYRPNSHQRGYDGRWRKARKSFLVSHPLCEHCKEQGVVTLATVVDHIVPHKGNKELFWDMDNWQSLCESCHNRKTASEDMGAWY